MSKWERADFSKEIDKCKEVCEKRNKEHEKKEMGLARKFLDKALNNALASLESGNPFFSSTGDFEISCTQRQQLLDEAVSKNPTAGDMLGKQPSICRYVQVQYFLKQESR